MINKNILKYLGIATLVLNLNAEEVYTIDDLIIKSLENSPNLQISKANYEASKSRYDSAFSGYLPSVDLHASTGESGQNDLSSNSNEMIHDTVSLGTLSAQQLLYDFGKTGGSVDTQKFDSQSYSMQNIQDISDKKRDVKEAYNNVLSALALIGVQKENVKLNEAQLYRAQKYFEAGIKTKIDVSDAKVSLIQAKLDLKKAEYNLKLTYANLDQVVGFTALEQEYKVYSEKLHLGSLFSTLHSYDLDLRSAIVYAYKNRALVKKQQAQINASTAQITEVKSEYFPSLYLTADYTRQQVDTFKSITPENSWQAAVNLDWNIYQGGSTSAREQEMKINANISNFELTNLQLSIKQETTAAYINVNLGRDSVELSQSLLEISAEKFDQASKRYEYGLSDFIELQQARQGYIDAKASLIVAYYNYYIAVANLDNAIGR